MVNTLTRIGFLATLLYWQGAALATPPTDQVEELIQDLATEKGYPTQTLRELLQGASRSQLVIDSLNRPAETVHTWKTYRPIFLKQNRIEEGVAYWENTGRPWNGPRRFTAYRRRSLSLSSALRPFTANGPVLSAYSTPLHPGLSLP